LSLSCRLLNGASVAVVMNPSGSLLSTWRFLKEEMKSVGWKRSSSSSVASELIVSLSSEVRVEGLEMQEIRCSVVSGAERHRGHR